MVTYLPRSAWKARASRGGASLNASQVEGEALHWPGMAKPINATGAAGQARVASALRGWQNYHMDGRGWSDIAYQIAIDQAGRAWTLRGLNIRSGANGDAHVNLLYGAFLLVLAPGEKPSAAMIATTKAVIADFRKRFPKARAKPYGHRDVRAEGTDCPGPLAYAAIGRGEFTPGTTTPESPTGEDVTTPTDVVGTDLDGTTMSMAELSARMNYLYQQVVGAGGLTPDKLRSYVQAENEEYNARLWGPDGTAGLFMRDVRAMLDDHTKRLARIEDDTDDAGKA